MQKNNRYLKILLIFVTLAVLIPTSITLAGQTLPPDNLVMQLPWDQGVAWVAVDGLDYGLKRPLSSPHNYLNGGAVDFAPHTNMRLGEDTSNYWVTAVYAGKISEKTACSVKIDHGNGWVTEYQFLANIQVKPGDVVYRNQRLGIIADGVRNKFCAPALEPDTPHLHFTLRPNMRGATLAGWKLNYDSWLNITTFSKNGKSIGLFQPLLNTLDLQIVLREPLVWEVLSNGSVDTYRYERWPFTLTAISNFTVTATATTVGMIPDVILLDSSGNEIVRGTGSLTSTQPAGSYFVQIQPQIGAGLYTILLHKNAKPNPTGPYVSVDVPGTIQVGETVSANVNLNNIPADGYTSAEFTCTHDTSLISVSNSIATDLFGQDAVTAINGPSNGSFIVAMAGSHDNKATADGVAFTFDITGIQTGQTQITCTARVSTGDGTLTPIDSVPASISITTANPTPTPPPVTPPPTNTWLTYTNAAFGFGFQYPSNGQLLSGNTDNYARINLPFVPGTNLSDKYLGVVVAEDFTTCQSPLAAGWTIPPPSETVVINGLTFFKQTGADATTGHNNKWTAYSITRANVCVSLSFVMHSVNPGVLPTPPPLYDETLESSVFSEIVSTYTWLALPPTVTATPPPALATITGQVFASKVVTVRLYDTSDNTAAILNAKLDGTFLIDNIPAGTYTIVATANGFMRLQGTITLTGGDIHAIAPISLLAGDIDDNGIIDQFDAMTIGFAYNTAEPPGADLNNDGIINVLDLELLAANYRKTGPSLWQP